MNQYLKQLAAQWIWTALFLSFVPWPSMAGSAGGVVVNGDTNLNPELSPPIAAQQGVAEIAAGVGHIVALKTDGTVIAWGYNANGQATVPDPARTGVKSVAAGPGHSLALKTDGTLVAWGRDEFGQTDVPESLKNKVQAGAAGYLHTVALTTNGMVVVWGDNSSRQTEVPETALNGITAIAAGWFHTLALTREGEVIAWGAGTNEVAYSIGGRDESQSVVPLAARSGVVAIAAGRDHSLALKTNGSVVVWGARFSRANPPYPPIPDLGNR